MKSKKKLLKNGARRKMRTMDEISQDYGQQCSNAGAISYQIDVLKRDLDHAYAKMRDLNIEATDVRAKQAQGLKLAPEAEIPPEAPAQDHVEVPDAQ